MGKENNNIANLLREIELFSALDQDILSEFAANMKEVELRQNEILFNKGDQDHALYIILDGCVQIHDNEYVFTTLNKKQYFGEYSLVDSSLRSATVTAVKDTLLLELEQDTFLRLTKKNQSIWQNILIALIKRLRDYNILEEKLTMRTLDVQKKKYEIEQEKESIKQQKKDLESINTTKDKFFSIIAYDLKTPFVSMHQVSETLKNDYDQLNDETVRNYIAQINKFSGNAVKLLENLLKWAQSQNGSLKINFKRTNLLKIVKNVIELFDTAAYQKELSFKVNLNENIYGYFDIDMITMVFRNLIANAIAYSKPLGQIFIDVTENNDMLNIEVRDEGYGMDEEVVNGLFKIENRKDMDASQASDTGLGLILCKEFVLKNGGEIWAESNKNKGTTIKFTLPKAL